MRARGDGFFAVKETLPYQPRGVLLGQKSEDSCVAACCRMLLLDQSPDSIDDHNFSESFLRAALKTDREGTIISRAPKVLREFGLAREYAYRRNLIIDELRKAVLFGSAIAIMRMVDDGEAHALIVEEISDEFVMIRDPLPETDGSAYRVSLDLFLSHWLKRKTGRGVAVIALK